MRYSRGNVPFVVLFWAFAFLLGVTISVNVPFVLLLLATLLYLFW